MRKPQNAFKVAKLMQSLEPGESFYLVGDGRTATHYAAVFGKKIATEVCLIIELYKTEKPKVVKAVKITMM